MSQTTQRRVVRKAMWRLLPILMAAFVIAYLDRLNISIGALEMRADTGLSAASPAAARAGSPAGSSDGSWGDPRSRAGGPDLPAPDLAGRDPRLALSVQARGPAGAAATRGPP